ncbi:glycosyltransferase family 2 protein [Bifidobacterium sp. MA2]|uniref:Glycosyltransferase family 2 protein n=1 Tax=Bifidobacterium santillanense TaxID=2809028 RepID=A0ABS5UQ07_9BIFI|nr:glycosyltransferase family 2 protein [Bifidobacterium santillanense]MBT1172970.1 glycosyltransferase family 2 protein [Bifidobacterium santillanense]
MPSITGGVRQIVNDALAARPYSHSQNVERAVAAVIAVERDLRFLPSTLSALLRQSVLPGAIIIADCSGQTTQPVELSFEVVAAGSEPLERFPEATGISVQLVRAQGARSFGEAVSRALDQAHLDYCVQMLWLLHDDSRPADDRCLEQLVESWRNTPGASLIGAKQLDWEGTNLHNVGAYASGHGIHTLVVDGEPDQEQYDTRSDVFAVSLAGALVPLDTVRSSRGISNWFGTYAQGADLCRRICRGGGRVVVAPRARIAHRRARFEGMRTRGGEPAAEGAVNPSMGVLDAWQRYRYTDIPAPLWPLVWLWSLIAAIGSALRRFAGKQPFEAGCELALPWRALIGSAGAFKARRAVTSQTVVTRSQLAMLSVTRDQLARWREREQALEEQCDTVLLSPLVRSHLRMRLTRRWGLAIAMAVAAFVVVLTLDWSMFRAALGGGSLRSAQWLPTNVSLGALAEAATTQWVWGVGTGVAAPPAPWLWVLLVASLLTGGHVAAATSLIFFAAAPAAALAFWALAGVFTRSDAVRVITGLMWMSLGLALGLYSSANLPMLTVMVFLPAAFAFTFRAVGLYHTEDRIHPHRSVQAAAAAALCYMPTVAAEPQLLLPLVLVFLVFLVFVPRHRAMLLLMPLPAALLIAPTLVNAVRYMDRGEWRQLFGDMTLPLAQVNRHPAALNLVDVIVRAFGLTEGTDLAGLLADGFAAATLAVVATVTLLAIVSLVLPFALRASRMMWVVIVAGGALSLVSSRVAIAVDASGSVAGSVMPGLVFAMLGALSCVCLVAGGAVRRFVELQESAAASADLTRVETRRRAVARVRHGFIVAGRTLLCLVLAAGVVSWTGYSTARHIAGSVTVSDSGLPMVAMDSLERTPDQRVLALDAESHTDVSYAVMHTSRGDLVDSSPAWRARQVVGQRDADDVAIGELAARLLSNSDSDAIDELAAMGFGGLFVVTGGAGADQLATNITASNGTQTVVTDTDGTYYRLTAAEGNTVGIDATHLNAMRRSPWRAAWLASLGVVTLLYVLVAAPRRHPEALMRQERQEEEA